MLLRAFLLKALCIVDEAADTGLDVVLNATSKGTFVD
jgi:hypothetical protein